MSVNKRFKVGIWRGLYSDVSSCGVKVDGDVAVCAVDMLLPVQHVCLRAGLQHRSCACRGVEVFAVNLVDADVTSVDDEVSKVALAACDGLCGFWEVRVAKDALNVCQEGFSGHVVCE